MRIVVVGSDHTFRNGLEGALYDAGHEFASFPDWAGVEVLLEAHPEIDCIVADPRPSPGCPDVQSLAREVTAGRPKLKVFFLAEAEDCDLVKLGAEVGFAFLRAPGSGPIRDPLAHIVDGGQMRF